MADLLGRFFVKFTIELGARTGGNQVESILVGKHTRELDRLLSAIMGSHPSSDDKQ